MTSFFHSPASKPPFIDGGDLLSFDLLDGPEPHSLVDGPFDLAAKLLCHQSSAQVHMDPHKPNNPGLGPKHDPDNSFVPPDPYRRQLHAQLLRQNSLDMLGLSAPQMEDFQNVPDVCTVPELLQGPVDYAFIHLVNDGPPLAYPQFPLENDEFSIHLLQQPIPHKPASQQPPAHSTPSSTQSVLTPVSSVTEEAWGHFSGFPDGMSRFASSSSLRPENPSAQFGPTPRQSFRNSVHSFARTPELPMRHLNNHYLPTANKAETALSLATLPLNRRTALQTPQANNPPTEMVSPRPPEMAPRENRKQKSNEENQEAQPVPKKKHKRTHTQKRSREGCWICRIKHLKCDETRPACNHCNRFGVACDYNPDRPDYVSDWGLRRKKLDELAAQRRKKRR